MSENCDGYNLEHAHISTDLYVSIRIALETTTLTYLSDGLSFTGQWVK